MSVPADLLIYFILALGALIISLDVLRRRQLRALQRQLQNPDHQIGAALTRLESKIETEFRVLRELEQTQRSDAHQLRKELTASSDTLQQRVMQGLQDLLTHNAKALEEVRKTVDEKLSETLDKRLTASFKLVGERLEKVHLGLGEMQALAQGVGDLKNILSNVKTRGIVGETILANILDECLPKERYEAQVKLYPNASEIVDFAIKLPGREDETVWLPIDAKFPREDYERLLEAERNHEDEASKTHRKALEKRVLSFAKSISEKYVQPPYTTDFAILFLPSEGLYARCLESVTLFEKCQREHRVVLAGPTTILALMNSLYMGFRSLAIQKQSSEVWKTLGQVKTEFGRFETVLLAVDKKLHEASNKIKEVHTRSERMQAKLKDVEDPESLTLPVLHDGD